MSDSLSDYAGNSFEPCPDARILSLVPSLTELLFDLGLEGKLVGRTHYCIHPADRVAAVPSVGGTKKIKMDRVRDLKPTHALVNVDENPKDMADALAAEGIAVVVTHPLHPDDNVPLYELIGGLFGANAAAADLIRRYKAARAILGDATAYPRRRAVYLIWRDPWMAITADTYIGAALSLMNIDAVTPGADPALDGDAARYPAVTLDDDALAGVDLVLFSTEPFAFTDDHLAAFRAAHPDHAHKAHLIDGEMTSWYGSRAIAGLGYLQTFAEKLGANG